MKIRFIIIILFLAYFLLLVFTLPHYGLNEDTPFHFLRGQAYLELLTSRNSSFNLPRLASPVLFIPGQKISLYKLNAWETGISPVRSIAPFPEDDSLQNTFNNFQKQFGRISFYKNNAWNGDYFKNKDGPGHPPVSDILASLTNRIFYEKLGLLGDVEAYHFYIVITALFALVAVFFFTRHISNTTSAFVAVISLGFFPLFFSESHFNIKDIPELSFFTISIISFYYWLMQRKNLFFIIFTLSFFLALGTKLNVLSLPIILLFWLFTIVKTPEFKRWFSPKLILYFFIFLILNSLLLILFWPYLWSAPVAKILDVFNFYVGVGSVDPRIQLTNPFYYPVSLITGTTPPLTLILFILGFFYIIKTIKHDPLHYKTLLILWLIIPLLRVLRPQADVFGSIRPFLEFLPSFAIFSGLGSGAIIKFLNKILSPKILSFSKIFLALYFLYLININLALHPNQNAYFNFLAQKNLFSWQTSYDNPYRQGVNFLNQKAPTNATLAYLDGTMTAISPIWLRSDIRLGSYFSGLEQKGEYIITIVYPAPPKVFQYLYLERFLNPIYEVKANNLTIAKVYQNLPNYVKDDHKKIVSLPVPEQSKGNNDMGNYWQIDFGKTITLVSLSLEIPQTNCIQKDGLFFLTDYFIPEKLNLSPTQVKFNFPAEPTSSLRFYGLDSASCFLLGKIQKAEVLLD